MKIQSGKSYITPNSSLIVRVHKIYHESDTYYKANISLVNKTNGIVYETKGYKLMKSQITHWEENKCPMCESFCGNEWCSYA